MTVPSQSGELNSLLLEHLHAGVVVHAPDTSILFANDQACAVLGLSLDQIAGKTAMDPAWCFLREDETVMPLEEFPVRRVLATGTPLRDLVVGVRRPATRDTAWAQVNAFPEISPENELLRVVVTFIDITDRRLAEYKQRHLTEVLRAIRNVNQLITHEGDRDALLRQACDLLTETRGYRSAWIALRDAEGSLRAAAVSGIGAEFDAVSALLGNDVQPLCCRLALGQPDIVVMRDVQADCVDCPLARQYRDAAAFVAALRYDDREYGVLVVALPQTIADDPEEQSLFREVVGDLSFALHAIEAEQERSRATELLRESETLYRDLFGNMLNGFAYCRVLFEGERPADFVYLAVNRAFETQTGLRDVVGERVTEVIPGIRESDPGLFEIYGRVARTGVPERFETYVEALQQWFEISVYSPSQDHFVAVFNVITERKRAEESLRASAAKLEAALESATDAVFISDAEGRIVEFNEAFATFHKFRGKAECPVTLAEHQKYLDVYLPDGSLAPPEQWAVPRALRGETATNAGYSLRRRDTGERWEGSYSFAPIRNSSGDIIGSVVVGRDITEQKRAEAALRESQHLLQTVLDLVPHFIFVKDRQSRHLLANRACAQANGMTPEQMIGRCDLDFVTDREQAEAFMRDDREVIDSGKPRFVAEESLTDASGRTRILQTAKFPFLHAGNEPALMGIAVDITDLKRTEASARESEERFRTLVDAAPDGIFVLAGERILFVNPAMVALLGAASADELLGANVLDWLAPGYHEVARSRIRDIREQGKPMPTAEREYIRTDGSSVKVETVAVPFTYQGQDAHLVFVRDISTRLEAEAEHERLREQLQQAQRLESIGRLAGGVAHDFNNLLTVQLGYCEVLQSGLRADDPVAEGLSQISACAERAAALTRQLLAFSRKQTLQPKVMDLNSLVNNMGAMLRRLIGEDVALASIPASEPAMVTADPGQIEQVLANLAVNARDAMPQGGSLTIGVSLVDLDEAYAEGRVGVKPGPYVMLSVSDTGCGMDEETQRRAFEPFFTTKEEGKGTGLGLASVYGIVQQSGGHIWFESEPGAGTTFKVSLPRVAAAAAQVAEPKPEITCGGGETVLIVEDEIALRRLAARMVEKLGYKAVEAANGGAAVIMVEQEGVRPDLVITDVVMPGMNGRVLVECLRKTLPGVKVIYMSGYTDDDVVAPGLGVSGDGFLQKPFSSATLAATIRSALTET